MLLQELEPALEDYSPYDRAKGLQEATKMLVKSLVKSAILNYFRHILSSLRSNTWKSLR
jgi:hypothetical protein